MLWADLPHAMISTFQVQSALTAAPPPLFPSSTLLPNAAFCPDPALTVKEGTSCERTTQIFVSTQLTQEMSCSLFQALAPRVLHGRCHSAPTPCLSPWHQGSHT